VTWSLFGSEEKTERSGGALANSNTFTQQATMSLSWNPLSTASMYASAQVVNKETGSTTVYNWMVNWSPFREGTLQMIFAYNEVIRPDDDGYDRLFSPSLRWEVRRGTFLDLTYSRIQSKSNIQESETRIYSAIFQTNF